MFEVFETHAASNEIAVDSVTVHAGRGDPALAARRFSLRHPGFRGRIVVDAVSTPKWDDMEPVSLVAWFSVVGPGIVKATFVRAGPLGSALMEE